MKTGIFLSVLALGLAFNLGAMAGDFTSNGDGTVIDNDTGLIWQQTDDRQPKTWEQTLAYCEGLELASRGDWRLPNAKELESITDDSTYNPAIDTTYFPNTLNYYWSSTTVARLPSDGWYVNFYAGWMGTSNKTASYRAARCVR